MRSALEEDLPSPWSPGAVAGSALHEVLPALAAGEPFATGALSRHLVLGHFAAIVQAVQLKTLASQVGPAGAELIRAAERAIDDELDDWCGTAPSLLPLPHPHRAAELGACLASFAAHAGNGRLRGELLGVVQKISSRLAAAAER